MNSSSQLINEFVLNVWRKVWQTAMFFRNRVQMLSQNQIWPNTSTVPEHFLVRDNLTVTHSDLKGTFC